MMRYAVLSRPPASFGRPIVRLLITDVPAGLGGEAVSSALNAARIVHGLPDAAIAAVTRSAGDPYFEVTAEAEWGDARIPPGTPDVHWDRFVAAAWGWPAVAAQAAQRQIASHGTWQGHVGARPACDPALPPRARARLYRAWTMQYWPFCASPAHTGLRRRNLLGARAGGAAVNGILFGSFGAIVLRYGNAATPHTRLIAAMAILIILGVAVGGMVCGPAAEYLYARYIGWRYRGRHVHLAMLAAEYQPLLLRAQLARDAISESAAAALAGDPAAEAAWQEWEIARRLRQITEHQQRSCPERGEPAAGDAIDTAAASVARRVSALENLATQLTRAACAVASGAPVSTDEQEDDADLDLLAGTAADDHAVADINRLADQVAAIAPEPTAQVPIAKGA